jgi:hypothetical protein
MRIVTLKRYSQDRNQTLGICVVFNSDQNPIFTAISLERGWRDNEKSVSCIPKGEYRVVLEYSPRFKKDLWEIKGVDGRSETKFHAANYWHQLNGCIALGRRPKDMNKDGYVDVTGSRDTMNDFHRSMAKETEFQLTII